jgi:putative hydrolase of the HAD superfamily
MIDPSKIKVITFDLGNVLLPFSRSKVVFNLARVSGLSPFKIGIYFLFTGVWLEFVDGKFTTPEFYQRLTEDLKWRITEAEFYQAYSDIFKENWIVINLLPKLKEKYRLFILSDINPLHADYLPKKYDFFSNFERFITSCEIKARKPSAQAFQIMVKMTGVSSDEIFFIDDRKCNVKGARRQGINALHFTTEDKFVSDFRKLGFLHGLNC